MLVGNVGTSLSGRTIFFAFFNSMLLISTQFTFKPFPVSLYFLRFFSISSACELGAEKREQKDMFHTHLPCAVILHIVYSTMLGHRIIGPEEKSKTA